MRKNIQKEENLEDIKIKEYMNKYIQELKRHFDVSDKKMRTILYEIYDELPPFSFLKNAKYMLKSFYKKIIKKRKKNDY